MRMNTSCCNASWGSVGNTSRNGYTSCVSSANHTERQCLVEVVKLVIRNFSGNVRLDGEIVSLYKSLN